MNDNSYEIEDDSYYLYACAELKSREREFVSGSRKERMMQARDMDEFLKVLNDTSYASKISMIGETGNFQGALISVYKEITNYLENRLKDEHKKIINILFFEEFLHNMKVLLKSSLLEKDFEDLYIPIKYEYGSLSRALDTQKYEDILDPVPDIIDHLREMIGISGDKDLRQLELDLEAFYVKKMLGTAESLSRKMMIDYVRHKIDLINIETIYRRRQLKMKIPFSGIVHKGGFIKPKVLSDLETESMDYFVRELESTEYGDVIVRGAQQLFSDCSFASFERNRDDYFLQYFDRIKYSVSNLEKIFHFFFRKKIEVLNINILYTGIKYNVNKSNLECRID